MSVVPPPGSLTVGGDRREIHLAEPHETPPIPHIPPIPDQYGENRLLLLVRDPTTLFASWELAPEALREAAVRIGVQGRYSITLRVLELAGEEHSALVREADVTGAQSWYIYHDRPGSICQAQLGVKSGDAFYPVLQSMPVHIPKGRESDRIDEDWSTIEEVLVRSRLGQTGRGSSAFL